MDGIGIHYLTFPWGLDPIQHDATKEIMDTIFLYSYKTGYNYRIENEKVTDIYRD